MIRRRVLILIGGLVLSLLPLAGQAYDKKPFIIAVAGGSASGKTHNARMIVEALGPERTTLLSMDHYYAPEKQTPEFFLNGSINYDHPSAVDLRKLALHLQYIKSGFPVSIKEYTYGQKVEVEKMLTFQPKEFVVVEGIFALYPEIVQIADFRVFVDVDRDTRFRRRLARDQKERGLSEEAVRSYFDAVVEPMHAKYIQPTALRADVVIESPDDKAKVVEIVRIVKDLAVKNRSTKFDVLAQSYSNALVELMENSDRNRFEILSLDQLTPTQTEVGHFNLSNKSYIVDTLIRESSVAFDLPSKLVAFLRKNPIPAVKRGDTYFVVDHHHLLLALNKKGINQFYVEILDNPKDLDPRRLELMNRDQPLTFQDLKNNSYRSLASLVRDLGHIRKTGKPHEEFEWAEYFRGVFEDQLGTPVTEGTLIDSDGRRDSVVAQAIELAKLPAARGLPGFLGPVVGPDVTICETLFIGTPKASE